MWFKVDDRFHSSRKVLAVPRRIRLAAIGLWTVAGSWSAGEELDGYVPDYMVEEWGGTGELVDALVAAGLWETASNGTTFAKWAEYQPTREQMDEKREHERVRKAEWRARKASHGTRAGQTTDTYGTDVLVPSNPTRPDPTRPDPLTSNLRSEVRESATGAHSPFCSKHPEGTDDPCRACGKARMGFEANKAAAKNRPTPLPPVIGTPKAMCPNGNHKYATDGTCIRCEYRPEEAA
jgi:hypothetical protein